MRSKDSYLKDVQLIKEILHEQEDRVLLRPWVFASWAVIIALATGVSTYLRESVGWTGGMIAWRVWIAAILLGGVLETAGWLRYLRREEPVVLTAHHIKLLLSFVGVIVAACAVVSVLIAQGADISAVLPMLLAICMFILAVFTFKSLFAEAYALLFLGIFLAVVDVSPGTLYQIAGYGAAVVFAAAALHTRYVLKGRNE